jgi:hypothetical protein
MSIPKYKKAPSDIAEAIEQAKVVPDFLLLSDQLLRFPS